MSKEIKVDAKLEQRMLLRRKLRDSHFACWMLLLSMVLFNLGTNNSLRPVSDYVSLALLAYIVWGWVKLWRLNK